MTVSELARLGGKARAKKLSKEEKSAIGKKGAEVRWGKVKDEKTGEYDRDNTSEDS